MRSSLSLSLPPPLLTDGRTNYCKRILFSVTGSNIHIYIFLGAAGGGSNGEKYTNPIFAALASSTSPPAAFVTPTTLPPQAEQAPGTSPALGQLRHEGKKGLSGRVALAQPSTDAGDLNGRGTPGLCRSRPAGVLPGTSSLPGPRPGDFLTPSWGKILPLGLSYASWAFLHPPPPSAPSLSNSLGFILLMPAF